MRAIATMVAALGLCIAQSASAQDAGTERFPVPPCAGQTVPAYPGAGPTPEVRVWRDDDIADWTAQACIGFGSLQPNMAIATAGRFHADGGIDAIARRLARISALTSIRYYSVTKDEWKPLFSDAYALDDVTGTENRRADFTEADFAVGRTLRYWQEENSMLSPVVYRLTIDDRTQDRLVYSVVNESAAKVLFFRAGEPGELRQYYVIEREAGNLWRYYALAAARIRTGPFSLSSRSFMFRAIAYFRYVAGFADESDFRRAP